MWTDKNRAKYNRDHLRYPSDVTDEEWKHLEPLIPPAKRGGRKREVDMREVLNGVMYVLGTGCQWRYIPKDLPPKSTVCIVISATGGMTVRRTEVKHLDGHGPELDDTGAVRLRLLIHEVYGFLPTQELFEQVLVDMAHANRFHPVREYLESLKWDRTPRIHTAPDVRPLMAFLTSVVAPLIARDHELSAREGGGF